MDVQEVKSIFDSNKGIILTIVVIISYVLGYMIRLWTPDDLDKISANTDK